MNRNKIEFSLNVNSKNLKKPLKNQNLSDDESDSSFEGNNKADYHKNLVNNAIFQSSKETEDLIQEQIAQSRDVKSTYDYDSNYEELKNLKKEKEKPTLSKAPLYMHKIINAAEKKKIEKLQNVEKIKAVRYQKETGKDFSEIPKFITKGYQKKLEELALDAAKYEKDNPSGGSEIGMIGFYSHLLTKNKLYTNDIVTNFDSDNKNEDISAIAEQRKKQYEKALPPISDDKIKKIVKRENEIKIAQTQGIEKETDREAMINKYKERYLQRKTERNKK